MFLSINTQVTGHPGLRERHFGHLQGLTYEEAPAAQPQAWAVMQGSCVHSRIPGGGESLQELDERIAAALLDIAATHPGRDYGGLDRTTCACPAGLGLDAAVALRL
jgi:broad specificity phosphatase PhoE